MSLDPRLADELRRARDRLANARSERDRLVVRALQTGASTREVAEVVGLSHTGVQRIRDRFGDAPGPAPSASCERDVSGT